MRQIAIGYSLFAAVAMALLAGAAVAASSNVTYQGVLRDSAGDPVANGTYTVNAAIFAVPTGGTVLWQESHSATTVDGTFSLELGSSTPFGALFENNSELYLQLSADTGSGLLTYNPRVALGATPYAHQAQHAEVAEAATTATTADMATSAGDADTVDGAHAAALEESAEIDADIAAHSADTNAHPALEESAEIDADIAAHDADSAAHANMTLDAAQIASGTIDSARLSTGPGSGLDADTVDGFHAASLDDSAEIDADVAAHNTNTAAHANMNVNAGQITSGLLDFLRIPTGTGASQVATGNHGHNLQDLGGAVTDAQVPDSITIANALNAGTVGGQPASAFSPLSHQHAASQITSGTLAFGLLPVGVGSTQVAQGDHSHTLDALSNVSAPAPEVGNVLAWNGTEWVQQEAPPNSGVRELAWSGFAAGANTIDVRIDVSYDSVMEVTAVFGHCSYIGGYGASRKAFVMVGGCFGGWNANGWSVLDMQNTATGNGGNWLIQAESETRFIIRKQAGTYGGTGNFFITVKGHNIVGKVHAVQIY